MAGREYSAGADYRYGFNGQEKSDELKGEGDLYTAAYWEYDSRLARRWNIDPMLKANRSAYHTFSNSPLIKIDPNGDDDYWSIDMKTGKLTLVKSDDLGRKIFVMMGDKPVLLSEIDIKWKNKQLTDGLADIVATYAQQSQIIFNGNCPEEDGQRESGVFKGGIGIAKAKKDDELAFYDRQDQGIYVAVVNGRIDVLLSNHANLKNALYHEYRHKLLNQTKSHVDHGNVYADQIEHSTFSETTSDFKIQIIAGAYKELEDAKDGNAEPAEKVGALEKRLDESLSKQGYRAGVVNQAGTNKRLIKITNTKDNQSTYVAL